MNTPRAFAKKKSPPSLGGNSDPKNCFNLEDVMQFEAARQRALARLPPENGSKPFSEFVPKRIFINHVDTFNGIHYVKFLSEKLKEEVEVDGETYAEIEETKTDYVSVEEENDGQLDDKSEDETSRDSMNRVESSPGKSLSAYEIIGTLDFLDNPNYVRPEGILELLDNEKKTEFLEKVLSCGVIIYDITSVLGCHPKQIEEAKWVAESIYKRLENLEKNQPRAFLKYNDCRTFILVSTLLTWAKTKPIDPEDPTLPFTERDFRKRKPHPNYKIHCEIEKRIIELGKKYPNHFRTLVIGSGIPYGQEEDVFHFCFKMAWMVEPHLPVFGSGKNVLPVVHIETLSSILYSVIESFPEKHVYIIATDPQAITLKQMMKLLANHLGSGKTVSVSKEEALMYPDIKQRTYDMLTANINVVPGFIMDRSNIEWASDRPLTENMDKIIEEFKLARGLLPVKVFVHGPPASGKSFLAKRLSSYYDIPHLHVKGVIDEAIENLKTKIENLKKRREEAEEKEKIKIEGDLEENEEEEVEEDDEEEEEEDLETLMGKLKEIEESMDNPEQRLDEEHVVRFFKEKMLSNLCQNKGYIIDGYPKTMAYTKMLYDAGEENEEEEGESEVQGDVSHLCDIRIMPTYVESLDASDEFLIERVIKMPEINVQNSHYEEPEMCRRLAQFRAWNTEDNTPLIYYDELDVHPMIYNVENDADPIMEPTFRAIISRIGPPRNYEKEGCGIAEIIAKEKRAQRQQYTDELKAQREELKRATQERRESVEQWMLLKNQELEMEEKALLVMGLPLRHYLMKYIFPTLTRGLVEVARIRPEDPLDFLSEFLFRENPEGKMFQPNFEEREEKLEKAIQEYENSLSSKQSSQMDKSSRAFSSSDKSGKSGAVSAVSGYKCSFVSTSSKKGRSKNSSSRSLQSRLSKTESQGTCTCKKSPSLSTCSSDANLPTPHSCTCSFSSDNSEACTPSDADADQCKCTC